MRSMEIGSTSPSAPSRQASPIPGCDRQNTKTESKLQIPGLEKALAFPAQATATPSMREGGRDSSGSEADNRKGNWLSGHDFAENSRSDSAQGQSPVFRDVFLASRTIGPGKGSPILLPR